MNERTQNAIDRTVSDITPTQRDAIEDLIGGELSPDQRVFILAYRPGVEPSESEKASARARIEELLTQSHDNARLQEVSSSEIDDAIAEAIRSTDE
jgi:hypothetical protein